MTPPQTWQLLTILLGFLALCNTSPLVANVPTTQGSNPINRNFRLTMARAVRTVQEHVPGAQLHRIECTSAQGPTLRPSALTDIRLFFASPLQMHPSLILRSHPDATLWGQWLPLEYSYASRPLAERPIGDILTSDITHVVQEMAAAGQGPGVGMKFDAVDIVRDEGMTEVWWTFQIRQRVAPGRSLGKRWVWVGDESGTVEVEDSAPGANVTTA
ncbi:MAG: hypothetical protein L6R41_006400 [Letrouitia leprolyta]|nr:MAG: hypothetical protein L6R41_006400 [Letrouitia leprolyta]